MLNVKRATFWSLLFVSFILTSCGGSIRTDGSDVTDIIPDIGFSFGVAQQPSMNFDACTDVPVKPIVQYKDGSGNLDTTFSKVVTAYLYTDDACTSIDTGAMVGTYTVMASGGVADFSGTTFHWTKSGTYYWGISAAGEDITCIGPVNISAGAATKLEIVTDASTPTLPNTNFTTAPAIEVTDACDNRVDTSTDAVTLDLYTEATCTTAGGGAVAATTNPLTTTSGLSSFSNVQYSAGGTYYVGGD